MSKLKSFVVATQQKVGFWEMLIPVFMELLQALMEQCANTEQQAVAMLTEPTPAQMRIMHRRMLLALHRDKSVPLGERNATAWQIVYAGIEEANANPEVVVAAFNEVKSAA
jgi:hypothetical protein